MEVLPAVWVYQLKLYCCPKYIYSLYELFDLFRRYNILIQCNFRKCLDIPLFDAAQRVKEVATLLFEIDLVSLVFSLHPQGNFNRALVGM